MLVCNLNFFLLFLILALLLSLSWWSFRLMKSGTSSERVRVHVSAANIGDECKSRFNWLGRK